MLQLGADVRRWYGETIGFWDGDVLVTWTSSIQGWTSHGQFEFSNQMQTVEIYSPRRDANLHVPGLESRRSSTTRKRSSSRSAS